MRKSGIRSILEEENRNKFRNIDIRWLVADSTDWISFELDFVSRRLDPYYGAKYPTNPGDLQKIETQNIPFMLKRIMKLAPKSSRIKQVLLFSAESVYDRSSFNDVATEGRVNHAEVEEVINAIKVQPSMKPELPDRWLDGYIFFSGIAILVCIIVLILVPSITGKFPLWLIYVFIITLVKIFLTVGLVVVQGSRTEKMLKDRVFQVAGVLRGFNSNIF